MASKVFVTSKAHLVPLSLTTYTPGIKKIAGMNIKLKFSEDEYNAVTGIAAAETRNEYFWINTHNDDAGFLVNILQKYNYKRNQEILIRFSHKEDELIAYVV